MERIEKKFISEIKWKEKEILTAKLQSLFKLEREFIRVTCSHVTVTLEGRKNEVDIELAHTYCPFCGKKINEDAIASADENIEDQLHKAGLDY